MKYITRSYKEIFFSIILFLSSLLAANATHIRAGEITARRINDNTYEFTLTVYANSNSSFQNLTATFDFGDGTSSTVNYNAPDLVLNSDTYRRTYTTIKGFSGNGTFRVSYTEFNRNANILNMFNSVNTPFYVETFISISSFIGVNNPVQLTIPPIDKGAVGELFVHNPGAFDPDGDSISYRLVIPRTAPGSIVAGYSTPTFSNSFTLNPITGDLRWDTPVIPGLYNIAFVVDEWRKGADSTYSRISSVTRDMQIRVENTNNNPPVVTIPQDTCIMAGANITKIIRATDPDNNQIRLTAFSPTFFSAASAVQNSPASGVFSWTPNCFDIREQPYSFVFKAEDVGPSIVLTDLKTWQIRVKGPKPQGLTTTAAGNSIVLSWNAYACSNASIMEIYRISCDSSAYRQQPCESGPDGFPGYVKIGEVPITTTNFLDNNNGIGLNRGINYCYLLVAKFPLPKGGESYASDQACQDLRTDAPLLTNVSVTATSSSVGTILVDWLAPTESLLVPPYTYNLLRATGPNSNAFTTIATNITPPFTDTNLNTLDQSYSYKVQLVGGRESDVATSVFASNKPSNKAITLNWAALVPWNDDSVYVYRSVNGAGMSFLTSFNGNPLSYKDSSNLNNCDSVCYYVQVFSSYCDPDFTRIAYDNLSQITCGVPVDDRLPNKPILAVKGCDGDRTVFSNLLDWNDVADNLCNNIRQYNVYYSDYEDTDLTLIDSTVFNITDYLYRNLQTTAGCFAISAVNRSGIEGEKSDKVCVDDCVYYELPNLITPNNDSLNDYFRPFPIPRGVEMVKFSVYNRWGALVFSVDKDIQLNWPARDNQGLKLSDGVYYFYADIKYIRRKNRDDERKSIKGWVQILNQQEGSTVE